MSNLQQFFEFCKEVQPQGQKEIQRFFEGVVCFPYDSELLLQSFLYFNIDSIFPSCQDLLLFEKAPNGENTDQGKCDFVYRSENGIVIIETKYIDTRKGGGNRSSGKNKKRKQVFDQVEKLRKKFVEHWNIPLEAFTGNVFTTEDLTYRPEADGITAKHISCGKLEAWQQKMKQQFLY
jgi:hypothetical protein